MQIKPYATPCVAPRERVLILESRLPSSCHVKPGNQCPALHMCT